MKITIDKEEFYTVLVLKNKELKHIINIYDGWRFKCIYNEEHSDNLFEYIDTSFQKDVIIKFVSTFKHAWFSIYSLDVEYGQNATYDDLDEYMRHPSRYSKAINFTKEYIINERNKLDLKEEFDNIYNQLLIAYLEQYKFVPKSHLDLNDGNIGFTSEGILKIFDMQ